MTDSTDPDGRPWRFTAWHEAGHVVVARHFGLGIREASIGARVDADGRALHGLVRCGGDGPAWAFACYQLGGLAGECTGFDLLELPTLRAQRLPADDLTATILGWIRARDACARHDLARARTLLSGSAPDVVDVARRGAERIVRLRRVAWLAVAEALLARHTLSGADVEELLERWWRAEVPAGVA